MSKMLRSLSLLVVFATSLVGGHASAADGAVCRAVPESPEIGKVCEQLLRGFEGSFVKVTADLPRQSQSNLAELMNVLREKRPGFDTYLKEAEARLADVDGEIIVTHQTHLNSALKILASGEILSMDELYRRGIVPLPSAKSGYTNSTADIDGKIGEQDTVFLAIQSGGAFSFGEVTFFFDKESVLNQGYFSAFPLDSGPYHLKTGSRKQQKENLDSTIQSYRHYVFQGAEAYRELLRMSLAHYLWETDQDFTKADEALKKLRTALEKRLGQDFFDNDFGRDVPLKASEGTLFRPLFEKLDQSPPSRDLRYVDYDRVRQNHLDRLGPADWIPESWRGKHLAQNVISAHTSFPELKDEKGRPRGSMLLTRPAGFWELKVPRSLPLESMNSVSLTIPEGLRFHPDQAAQFEADLKRLNDALEAYCKQRGWTMTHTVEKSRLRNGIDSVHRFVFHKDGLS